MGTKMQSVANYIKDELESRDIHNFLVLGGVEDRDAPGFSLAIKGSNEILTEMLATLFKNYPELLLQTLAIVMEVFRGLECDCEDCRKEREGKKEIDLEGFIAKGKLH